MTKFIRVTEIHSSGAIVDMIVNTENILSIKQSDRKTDTHIQLRDGKYLFVKETTADIYVKLITDNTKAPVIMTADEALKFYAARDGV